MSKAFFIVIVSFFAHHSINIQLNEPLYLVKVFQTCLFGTSETNLGKKTCERYMYIGEVQGTFYIAISHMTTIKRLVTIVIFTILAINDSFTSELTFCLQKDSG